jgi:hypothetical protein
MFKGMKKVLAGLLAAAIALTPVSSVSAATSPVVKLGPVTKHGNTPYKAEDKQMMTNVTTTNKGNAIVVKVNTSATKVTFTDVVVNNGKYYYVNKKTGKKVWTGKIGKVSYKVGAIKKGAFLGATKVKQVTLGTKFSQGRLEYKCFAGATSLKTIYIKARKINSVKANIFGNNVDASKIVVYVPKATTDAQFNRFVKQFTRAGVKKSNIKRSANY